MVAYFRFKIADAKSFPRTVVAWRAPIVDQVEPLKVEIQRMERQIAKPPQQFELTTVQKSAWDAIKTIEGLSDNSPIDTDDLAALKHWLSGEVVEVPGPSDAEYWVVFDPRQQKQQMAIDGVIQLPIDSLSTDHAGMPEKLSAWVDYFGRNNDYDSPMDANWDYQYRLRTFLDLGSSLGDQRYLFRLQRLGHQTLLQRLLPSRCLPLLQNPLNWKFRKHGFDSSFAQNLLPLQNLQAHEFWTSSATGSTELSSEGN